MAWELRYDPAAEKELAKLDRAVQRSVKSYLAEICQLEDPTVRGHGLTGKHAGNHRYRIGQLRIMVRVERLIVTVMVLKIDRRDSIY